MVRLMCHTAVVKSLPWQGSAALRALVTLFIQPKGALVIMEWNACRLAASGVRHPCLYCSSERAMLVVGGMPEDQTG